MIWGKAQPPPLWEQPEIVTPTITHILRDAGYTTSTILKNRRNHAFHVWDVDYDEEYRSVYVNSG